LLGKIKKAESKTNKNNPMNKEEIKKIIVELEAVIAKLKAEIEKPE